MRDLSRFFFDHLHHLKVKNLNKQITSNDERAKKKTTIGRE